MAMAIFGAGKKTWLQRAMTSGWKNEEEKKQVLDELRKAGVKPVEAVPLLTSQDPGVRQVGVDLFLDKPDGAAVALLIEQMSTQTAAVKAFISRLFSRIPPDTIGKATDELLNDRSTQKQKVGWEIALNLGGDLRLKYLERAVREAPPVLRLTALQRLVKEKDPATLVEVLAENARSEDGRLSATAVEALATVKDGRVIDIMVDRFARGDAAAREIANRYLQDMAREQPELMRKRILEWLTQGDDATRRLSVDILLKTGQPEKVIEDILGVALELAGWIRNRILDTLKTFGDEVLKPAVNLLSHDREDIRTSALVLCEHFNDPRIVGPVCKLLNDPDWWLRITACDTLGRLKDERSVPYLIKALEDPEARWAAIDALARIASPTALKPLANLLRDPRPEVRMEVASALGRFDDQRLLPLLQTLAARDPAVEVRTRATEVMRDLAARLRVSAPGEAALAGASTDLRNRKFARPLDQLLHEIRDSGYSDLHITPGEPPFVRRAGVLVRMEGQDPMPPERTVELIMAVLEDRQRQVLEATGELDLCHAIPEVGRYRANVFRQRKGLAATFRVIPNVPPTFSDLRLPGQLTQLLDYHQGIIVVSGPAGSGKSTSLAAIINLINESKSDHVITLEDPIEFVHPVKQALVNQREVGKHTSSFARALRGALRQDPDVIMVGEMRDLETIRLALMAAETGHLVIATLHTTSAIQTVERLIGAFPPEEQAQVRTGLSESLKYVLCQSLVRRKDGKGRVGVFEVLKNTFSISNLIRDDKSYQISSMMQIGRSLGMQTVDQALMDLVEKDLIAPETAWMRAENRANFESLCSQQFLREMQTGAA